MESLRRDSIIKHAFKRDHTGYSVEDTAEESQDYVGTQHSWLLLLMRR